MVASKWSDGEYADFRFGILLDCLLLSPSEKYVSFLLYTQLMH
jgi:hypothetical protein